MFPFTSNWWSDVKSVAHQDTLDGKALVPYQCMMLRQQWEAVSISGWNYVQVDILEPGKVRWVAQNWWIMMDLHWLYEILSIVPYCTYLFNPFHLGNAIPTVLVPGCIYVIEGTPPTVASLGSCFMFISQAIFHANIMTWNWLEFSQLSTTQGDHVIRAMTLQRAAYRRANGGSRAPSLAEDAVVRYAGVKMPLCVMLVWLLSQELRYRSEDALGSCLSWKHHGG